MPTALHFARAPPRSPRRTARTRSRSARDPVRSRWTSLSRNLRATPQAGHAHRDPGLLHVAARRLAPDTRR